MPNIGDYITVDDTGISPLIAKIVAENGEHWDIDYVAYTSASASIRRALLNKENFTVVPASDVDILKARLVYGL